ncbi:MAG: DUF1566 domain-containing protein [Candidatus Rokuibacteriota bacterium]
MEHPGVGGQGSTRGVPTRRGFSNGASGHFLTSSESGSGASRGPGPRRVPARGDGTITDNNTGLMWEKKSDDGSIHDKDTTYTWPNAFDVHIAALNTAPCFADHCDWRVPNVKELQSIVNYQNVNPSVSPAFNTGCVATCAVTACSCTAASSYWSSSTVAGNPAIAWNVDFGDGFVNASFKGNTNVVRAVRGGS